MIVITNYSNGSQKVKLDDGQTVILSAPYSNGERKISSENGQDLGYLTSQYSNGHKYARMNNGGEYDVSNKPQFFGGTREIWDKSKQGHADNPLQKEQSQTNATETDQFVENKEVNNNEETESCTEESDGGIKAPSTFDFPVKKIEINIDDNRQISDLKKEINDLYWEIRKIERHKKDTDDAYRRACKNTKRYVEYVIYDENGSWQRKVNKDGSRYDFYQDLQQKNDLIKEKLARLEILLEQQKSKDRRLLYLSIGLISDLNQFYGFTVIKWETSFAKFNITPLYRNDGGKSYSDGSVLIKSIDEFLKMSVGFPKGWKHTEYLLGKMGITTQEMVAAREYLKALKEKLRHYE